MDFLNLFAPTIEHFIFWDYWIVFLVLLIDSLAFVGLIFPGTLLVAGIGFLAMQGFLDIGDVIWFAATGAIVGDIISYYMGVHTGEKFFKDKNKIFKAKYLRVGQSFFDRHGSKAIFFDRFIGPVRPIATFIAGMSKMNKKTFILWSFLSSFSWVVLFLFIGYLFGQVWEAIALWSIKASIFLLGLILLFAILYVLKWIIIKEGKQFLSFLYSYGNQ